MKVLRDVLPDDGIVVDEVTQLGTSFWYGHPVNQRAGWSRPASPAPWLRYDGAGRQGGDHDSPVVSVTGDGRLLFRRLRPRQGKAVRHQPRHRGGEQRGLYGNVLRDKQRLYEGRIPAQCAPIPTLQVCAPYGVGAWRVETDDGLRGALKEALASEAPAV